MASTRLLVIEPLEDRTTPSTYGVPWPNALHLTLSFVPDGTRAGPTSSNLFALLDARYERSVWRHEVLRAFQTWVRFANINVVLTTDGGLPLGSTGAVQGDARFGDIRIAAYPMSPEVIAVASPFDVLAGTWSGDVKLNSLLFADGSPYDLFTVMVHEAGHVLGLDHSADPSSVMAEGYLGVRGEPSAADIAALQELYGTREPDTSDAARPNDTRDTAARLGHDGVTGDLTTRRDIDWYQFRPSSHARAGVVRLRAAEWSLLAARVSVYDEAGNVLASASADAPGSDLEVHLDGLRASQSYFIRVEQAADDAFGIGSYRLEAGEDEPGRHGGPVDPGHGQSHSSGPTAINLQRRIHRSDARFDYAYRGSFGQSGEVDHYRFHSPHGKAGSANVMTVLTWAADPGAARPWLGLFRADGSAVEATVLVSENGTQVLQLSEADENAVYLLAVWGAEGGGPGDYYLGIDFGTRATALETFVDHQPLEEGEAEGGTLHVQESRLFHLALSAAGKAGPTSGAVRLEAFDPQGNRVVTLTADLGDVASTAVFLPPSDYVFRARLVGVEASAGPVNWTLRGLGLSDPIGPQPRDVTMDPFAAPGDATSSGGGYWWQGGYHTFLAGGGPGGPGHTGSTLSATAAAPVPVGSDNIPSAASGATAGPSKAGPGASSAPADVARAAVDTVFTAQAAAENAALVVSGPARAATGSPQLPAAQTAGPTTPGTSGPAAPAWGGAGLSYLQGLTPAAEHPPPELTRDSDRPTGTLAPESPLPAATTRPGQDVETQSTERVLSGEVGEPGALPADVMAGEILAVVGIEGMGERASRGVEEPVSRDSGQWSGRLRLIGALAASLLIGLIGGGLYFLSGTPPWERMSNDE